MDSSENTAATCREGGVGGVEYTHLHSSPHRMKCVKDKSATAAFIRTSHEICCKTNSQNSGFFYVIFSYKILFLFKMIC